MAVAGLWRARGTVAVWTPGRKDLSEAVREKAVRGGVRGVRGV